MSTETHKCRYKEHWPPVWECPFDAEPGQKHCIFHLPIEKKEPEQFWKHLASYLKALLDKCGTKETGEWANAHPKHWVFREADDQLVVSYAARLKPGDPWRFIGFVFPKMDDQHNFFDFVFPEVDFRDAQFSSEADFSGAQFSGKASFWYAQFSGEAKAHFVAARFSREAYFSGAQFSREANFAVAQFSGEAYFSGAQFSSGANFSAARFSREAKAHFVDARFSSEASFWGAQFSGEADFGRAQFSSEANFLDAQFSGEANFWDAQFNGPVYLSKAIVNGLLDFTHAILRNRLLFEGTVFNNEAKVLLWSLDFVHGTSDITLEEGHRKGQIIEPAGQVVFRDISQGMNRVSLLHTDILTDRLCVRFSNVKWEKKPREFIFDARFAFCRNASEWQKATGLPQETLNQLPELFHTDRPASANETPEQKAPREAQQLQDCEPLVKQDVERIAREIRLSTEKFGSYSDAGDYHIAEMEYRRVQAKGFFRFGLELYKLTSEYGESPSLALKRLAQVWLVFSILYFLFGFNFRHPWPPLWKELPALRWLERAGWAGLYALVSMVPGYFRFQAEPSNWFVAMFTVIQAVLGIGLLTLFLLAIRRRFRR